MTTKNNPSPWTMEEVVEVLEPFAEIAEQLSPNLKDNEQNSMLWAAPYVGDLRRALALLSKIKERSDD